MKSIVAVNPFQCRMWEMHDRIDAQITEESCKAEIESFAKHGQLVPVLGRPLRRDPHQQVELIYGARRLFVARHLNVPLLVELREMSDLEAIVAMDIENRQRSDISPYERGQSYARFLRAGHFRSQEELARTLKVSPSQVSRLLKLAQLPPVIVEAFDSPASICEGWGLEIMQALEDPARRAGTIRAARKICETEKRPPGAEVFRLLMTQAAGGRPPKPVRRDEIVKDKSGAPLFRIRRQRSSTAILLPMWQTNPLVLDAIRDAIANILESSKPGPRLSVVSGGRRTHSESGGAALT
jgi:ParB family chromosome partitioning protein